MSLTSFEFENLFDDELPIPGHGFISNGMNQEIDMPSFENIFEDEHPISHSKTSASSSHDLSNGMNQELDMTSVEFGDIVEDEFLIPRSKTSASTSRHDISNGENQELDMTCFEFENNVEDELPTARSKTVATSSHDLSNGMNQELHMTSSEFEGIFEDEFLIPRSKTSASSRHDLSNGKSDQNDSRSESEIVEQGSGGSGYNIKQESNSPCKKKLRPQVVRHSDQQIKKLEELFKICPQADEKQREEIGKQIGLKSCQVNFWFQNHRTKLKNQTERYENALLRQENNKLRAENMVLKGTSPVCNRCYGPTALRVISTEGQRLRIENARLNDEIGRVHAIIQKSLGIPVSSLPAPVTPPRTFSLVGDIALPGLPHSIPPPEVTSTINLSHEAFMFRGLASDAFNELLKMALMDDPLWVPSSEGSKAKLNYEAYLRDFPRLVGQKRVGYLSDVSRDSGMVRINSSALVETFMKADSWANMFPSIIPRAKARGILSSGAGAGGSLDGALQLMQADLGIMSPLFGIFEVNFVRFSKKYTENVWVVVDVSVDGICENLLPRSGHVSCRRLPSGFIVQDLQNDWSMVTWLEHLEYDEEAVHHLYRPLLRSGLGMGAERWVASLQRQCESLATLRSMPPQDQRCGMMNLALRMMDDFLGVVWWEDKNWKILRKPGKGVDLQMMAQLSFGELGKPMGFVLSSATTVWLQVPPLQLLDYLCNDRSVWNIPSNGESMLEIARIVKEQEHGSAVSLLRYNSDANANQNNMLLLQETCIDASVSMVVYSSVEGSSLNGILNGNDLKHVELLPSGFVIMPDGQTMDNQVITSRNGSSSSTNCMTTASPRRAGGSLLTLVFQTLSNEQTDMEFINLASSIVSKIVDALHCNTEQRPSV